MMTHGCTGMPCSICGAGRVRKWGFDVVGDENTPYVDWCVTAREVKDDMAKHYDSVISHKGEDFNVRVQGVSVEHMEENPVDPEVHSEAVLNAHGLGATVDINPPDDARVPDGCDCGGPPNHMVGGLLCRKGL